MTAALLFTVKGTPRPQPRPRFVKGRVISTVSHHARAWRAAVRRALPREVPTFTGALEVSIAFVFRPADAMAERIGQPHTHKPDADNLAKLILDVLQGEKVIGDDCKVAVLLTRKVWGEEACAMVRVTPLVGQDSRARSLVGSDTPDWLSTV